MDTPLVTIVIPSWNRRELVCAASRSVIAQTCRAWELIVVDDGSDDGTAEALEALAEPRLRVVRCPRWGNASRLRNVGVQSGSGALVAFLDSDDLWLPDKLERQRAALRRDGARWCYGNFGHIDAEGRPIRRRAGQFSAEGGWMLRAMIEERTGIYIGTWLIERALFDAVGGFDETLRARGDLDLAFRLAAAAPAAAVADPVMMVREHPGRMTGGLAHPHELTALVWTRLLARETDEELRALAGRRVARLLAAAARRRLAGGEPGRAAWLVAHALGYRLAATPVARRLAARVSAGGARKSGRMRGSEGARAPPHRQPP